MTMERQRRRPNQSVTIRDVAAHVGVSAMTGSRVINRESNVKPETRELVDAAIRALNYAPSPAARSLAGSVPCRIGLLYDNPSTGYLSELLLGALDESSRTGAQVLVERCGESEMAAAVRVRARAGRGAPGRCGGGRGRARSPLPGYRHHPHRQRSRGARPDRIPA